MIDEEIRVWSTDGLILTRGNPGIRTEACPNTGLSTTNPTETGMGMTPSLSGQRPETSHLSRCATNVSMRGIKL
jgi:hypothetical protein